MRFATTILPVTITQYDAATQIMRHCEQYSPAGVPLTRRVATAILADARTRLNADLNGVVASSGSDVLYKARHLYAKAMLGDGGALKSCHWRTLVQLLELEHSITQNAKPVADSTGDVGRVEFVIVDPDAVAPLEGQGQERPDGAA